MSRYLALRPFREDRDAVPQEEVLQDVDVRGDRLSLDLGLAGDVRDVEDAAVREARGLEEPGEGADVPRQAFEPHFLLEVEGGVGAEDVLRPAAGDDEGKEPVSQGPGQLEGLQLRRHERVKAADEGTTPKQVETSAPELSRARPREDEPATVARLEELVHDREELRDALDLVEDNGVAAGLPAYEVTQPLGPRRQLPLDLRPQEIDVERVGQYVLGATSTSRSRAAPGGRSSRPVAGRSGALFPFLLAKRNLQFRNAEPR